MAPARSIQSDYPWTDQETPLICSAPMRAIAGADLTCAVSLAGGLGFLGLGTEAATTSSHLAACRSLLAASSRGDADSSSLPVGVGYLLWGIPDAALHSEVVPALERHRPAALWLYAPRGETSAEYLPQLQLWARTARAASPDTRIWIQIGSVAEAVAIVPAVPELDVLVVQGVDAGGHGLNHGAGLMSLLPEVCAVLPELSARARRGAEPHVVAAGGIALPSQVLASSVLGAQGVCLGTAFLATPEAVLAEGYRNEVLRANDGGQSTARSGVYDYLRGTRDWPKRYGGRGVLNLSYEDWMAGDMPVDANVKLYEESAARASDDESVWGPKGRMTTYAGTGVGLVQGARPAADVVRDLGRGVRALIDEAKAKTAM